MAWRLLLICSVRTQAVVYKLCVPAYPPAVWHTRYCTYYSKKGLPTVRAMVSRHQHAQTLELMAASTAGVLQVARGYRGQYNAPPFRTDAHCS